MADEQKQTPNLAGEPIETNAQKARPWLAVFPNQNPDPSQLKRYGIKKGEVLELAGNAGNFFAHDNWKLECESEVNERK